MKVLERKPWSWVFNCKGCGSKLEAEPGDVVVGYFGGSYCENGDREYYVSCPECGTDTIVTRSKLTAAVTKSADAKEKK
ncbi:MAG TPA: hypothetical protein VJJ02_03270 [Candidatus Paceibacterota bacterium]